MPVVDLIRHCLAYNKILKDDGVTLSSPPMATAPHLNIVEFLLSGPLESVVRSEQKKKKVHTNSIPFTVSSSCEPPTTKAGSCLCITEFSEPVTKARAAVGKSKIALQAPVTLVASHRLLAGALSCYLVTYIALGALRVALTC